MPPGGSAKRIIRAIADQARTIRLPVHMFEMINKLIKTSRYLAHELGREPNPEEIANKMEYSLEKARKLLSTLTPREEEVLRLRFGVSERGNYLAEESRESLDLSRERARQIEWGAAPKLRNPTQQRILKPLLK